MRLKFEIKPYAIIGGKGTTQDALRRLYGEWGISAMPTTFTNHGNFSHRLFDYKNAWFYTMQVYKRGKYRHNKHYEVRIYKVPMDILEYMKVKIYQNRGWIKIDKMIDGRWQTIKGHTDKMADGQNGRWQVTKWQTDKMADGRLTKWQIMTKERYEELDKMTMEELLKNPCVSSDEFNFLLKTCGKNINEIEFD